jgi:hypothetical protein
MEVNTQQAKKLLAGAMVLSLALSGSLFLGNGGAAAAGSAGLSRQGLTIKEYAQLQDMKVRWRKQTENLHKGGFALVEEAAKILNMDEEQLKKQLTEGKSIVEVAADKGVSEAVLTEKLLAARSAKLEEAVKAGKITQERADTIKTTLQSHIGSKLNQKGWSADGGYEGHGKHSKKHGGLLSQVGPDKMATMLGISKDQLVKELKAGKSLSEIAQEKGMSKDELVAKIKEELTPALEKAVDRKHPGKQEAKK